ncbi:uncharacterized protein JCM10292_005562 [Rhodotorula paludigena]|uniref:uncharacterized protein n=1 Tax=Rhodotorula paludigena TaxID=86838 RepID=UPI00316D3AF7
MAAAVVDRRSGNPSSVGPYVPVETIVRELRKRVHRHNQLVGGYFRVVRKCYSLLNEDDKKLCVVPSTQRVRGYSEHDLPVVEVVHMLDQSPFPFVWDEVVRKPAI